MREADGRWIQLSCNSRRMTTHPAQSNAKRHFGILDSLYVRTESRCGSFSAWSCGDCPWAAAGTSRMASAMMVGPDKDIVRIRTPENLKVSRRILNRFQSIWKCVALWNKGRRGVGAHVSVPRGGLLHFSR